MDYKDVAEQAYKNGYEDGKKKLLKEMYEQGKFDAIADLEKEGKVVVSKEEYERLSIFTLTTARQIMEQERKETAKKIFEELYMHFNSDYLCGLRNPNRDSNAERLVIRLAKEFGVEIKELGDV